MSLSIETVHSFLKPYAERPVVVAFSGGVDSTVLLHLLVACRDKGFISSLSAIHIHHGLSDNADHWAEQCQLVCQEWRVPLQVERVQLDMSPGDGIEQEARKCRYDVFRRVLPENGCLLQGHHLDDQAETVLFRLFRGSGVSGLAGIPEARDLGQGLLLRPLLKVSRQSIENYAKDHGLQHVEDESNLDQRFSRNYLRQSLIPEIERRWPGVSSRLSALAEEMSEVDQCLQEKVAGDAAGVIVDPPGFLWGERPVIDLSQLALPKKIDAARVLRFWFEKLGVAAPGREMLSRVFVELIEAREDAEAVLKWPGCELRRFNGYLASVLQVEFSPKKIQWHWQSTEKLELPGAGVLSVGESQGRGVMLSDDLITVCYRDNLPGGEKIRVAGRKGSKTVKRWLQEYRVPPWLRDRVPFLYQGERMIAAPGLWICEGFLADPHKGYRVEWQPEQGDWV
ncbi:MAG: tRNA lysidine(34) synthetase TilS [Endozoicomonas sp.]